MRLATGLRLDPLGELTALPKPLAGLSRGVKRGRGRKRRERKGRGGETMGERNGNLNRHCEILLHYTSLLDIRVDIVCISIFPSEATGRKPGHVHRPNYFSLDSVFYTP